MQEKLQKEVSLLRRRIDCAMGRALCEVLIKKATIAGVWKFLWAAPGLINRCRV